MKQIIIDNYLTQFYIDENGRVFNSKTQNWLKGTIRDGYLYYDLRFNNKKISKSAHRLVAENFLQNPDNLPCVHHIDGNRLNNNIKNLKWVSYHENNLSQNKKESNPLDSEVYIYDDDEEWRNYKNSIYSISSWGRIKNNKTGKILKGKIRDNGYKEYCLRINGQKKSFLAHRIVYETFYPFEKILTINHIDGDKLNNHINNLENVSQLQNNLKSIYETKAKKYKTIGQYDKEGNLIQTFTTSTEAAKAMGCSSATIRQAIYNNYCSSNYYWRYIED